MFKIRDSRDRESTTLGFVVVAYAIVLIAFAVNFVTVHACVFTECASVPEMISLGSFGSALALVLGIWLGREATEKLKPK